MEVIVPGSTARTPSVAGSTSLFFDSGSAHDIDYPEDRLDGDVLVLFGLSSYNITAVSQDFEILTAVADYVSTCIAVRVVDGTEGDSVNAAFAGSADGVLFTALVRGASGMGGFNRASSGGTTVGSIRATALTTHVNDLILSAAAFRAGTSSTDFTTGVVLETRDTDASYRSQMVADIPPAPFPRMTAERNTGLAQAGIALISFEG